MAVECEDESGILMHEDKCLEMLEIGHSMFGVDNLEILARSKNCSGMKINLSKNSKFTLLDKNLTIKVMENVLMLKISHA